MWLRVLSCGWMWLILEKRSEILDKNFISNIRFFLASEIQKMYKKRQVLFFLIATLRCTYDCAFGHICAQSHHHVPLTQGDQCCTISHMQIPSIFHLAPLQQCVPVFPITVISKMSIWFMGHWLDQMETSEVASDALSNSFTPWLVLSLINK